MRSVLLLLPLAACAAEPVPAAPGLRARQEAACTAAIAAHVRRAPDGITARRVSETGGTATVEVRDGNRLHLCQVDGSGRVLDFSHPGA